MKIQPYLFFEGRADEAIDFYKRVLDAKVTALMRNKEAPDKPPPGMLPPGSDDKVMHAEIRIGDSALLISDGMVSGSPNFSGVRLALSLGEAQAKKAFDALAQGGSVTMPLGKTFFAKQFGMVTDRFGVGWMIVGE
jgi:PhnB protein